MKIFLLLLLFSFSSNAANAPWSEGTTPQEAREMFDAALKTAPESSKRIFKANTRYCLDFHHMEESNSECFLMTASATGIPLQKKGSLSLYLFRQENKETVDYGWIK